MDGLAAVGYLHEHLELRMSYNPFGNHYAAMTVVVRDTSGACGLTVFAERVWAGGGWVGLGMTFMGGRSESTTAPRRWLEARDPGAEVGGTEAWVHPNT